MIPSRIGSSATTIRHRRALRLVLSALVALATLGIGRGEARVAPGW